MNTDKEKLTYQKELAKGGTLEIEIMSPELIEAIKKQYSSETVDTDTAESFIRDMLSSAIEKAESLRK
jgi:hypothetical protein